MKTSSKLFDLVQSLSKNEKGYFKKLYAPTPKEHGYLKLFDVLGKMKSYDEKVLNKKLNGYTFAKRGSLHVYKNELYKRILRSMSLYWEKHSPEIQLFNLINHAQLLEEKGLLRQSNQLLTKAKELAVKSAKTWILLEIKNRLATQEIEQNDNNLLKSLEDISLKTNSLCAQHQIEVQLANCQNLLFATHRTAIATNEQYQQSIIREAKRLLDTVQNSQIENTFLIQHHSIRIAWGIAYFERNYLRAHKIMASLIDLWDNFPDLIKEFPRKYTLHLFNYASSCLPIKLYNKIPEILQKAKTVAVRSFNEEAEVFQSVSYLNLLYSLNTLHLKEVPNLIVKIKIGLIKYASKVNASSRLTLQYNIAIYYFITEQFDQSLDWLKMISWDKKVQHREDLQVTSNILEMLLQYELRNHSILFDLHRAKMRYIKKNNPDSLFFKAVLKCFKSLIRAKDRSEALGFIKILNQKIQQLKINKGRQLGLEELELWAESKIKRKPIIEIMKDRL